MMEILDGIDQAMQSAFLVFAESRIHEHKKAFEREKKILNPVLQQEYEQLILLLPDNKDLLIDFIDHLQQKYFDMDRWFYQQGLDDCQKLYINIKENINNFQLIQKSKD